MRRSRLVGVSIRSLTVSDEVLARVAQSLWAVDFAHGFMVTHWRDLDDVAIESYVKDAKMLLAVMPTFGVGIVQVSDE